MRRISPPILGAGAALALLVGVPVATGPPATGGSAGRASSPASAAGAVSASPAVPAVPAFRTVRTAATAPATCTGAAAMADLARCPLTRTGPLTPTPAKARSDFTAASRGGPGHNCFSRAPYFGVRVCTFGDVRSAKKVALAGNSHAGQWLPALQVAAARYHWRIVTYLASACALAETAQRFPSAAITASCSAWVRKIEGRLARGGFRLIVMSNRVSTPAVGFSSLAGSYGPYLRGYTAVLRKLHAAHRRVYVIRDTPASPVDPPACLAQHPRDYLACAGPPSHWLPPEPAYGAAAAVRDRRIHVGNLTRYLCTSRRCPAAIGGVVVYRDRTHQTATYNRSIGPYLASRLHAFLIATS